MTPKPAESAAKAAKIMADLVKDALKWPDDFRGFGTNVKPKKQK
jgi:hypothetical protein